MRLRNGVPSETREATADVVGCVRALFGRLVDQSGGSSRCENPDKHRSSRVNHPFLGRVVPRRGLEPLLLAEPDPKSGASANFATSASRISDGVTPTR